MRKDAVIQCDSINGDKMPKTTALILSHRRKKLRLLDELGITNAALADDEFRGLIQ